MGPAAVTEKRIAELVGDAQHTETIRWLLVENLDIAQGHDVLMIVGDRWTAISLAEFVRLVTRILEQLT